MLDSRRHTRPLTFRSNATDAAERRFPRAVAGEDYDRYATAVWRQADRWLQRHANRVADPRLELHEARDILWSVATTDLRRRLYPQEERLLSELLLQEWPHMERAAEAIVATDHR